MNFETKAIHVGQESDPATGAVAVPVYQTSTYQQEAIGKHKGYEYSRTGNPTRTAFEKALASLEEAAYGLAFSSGVAATDAVLSLLSSGDHVIAADEVYGGTYRLMEKIYRKRGIEFSYADADDAGSFETAIKKNTKLIWIETPTNPMLKIIDIRRMAALAGAHKILFAVDNTFASPYLQRPLTLGADLVVHSTTKYIGGHSDMVGGAVLTSNEVLYQQLHFFQNAAGGVPGPWDSWLALRGLKTLAVRMKKHQVNALFLSDLLEKNPKVKRVYYPGLETHPGHEIASAQMDGFGGMITIELKGGSNAVEQFVAGLKIFLLAESLGGVESLVCYPAKMTHASIPLEKRLELGITDGVVRLSVGIEDTADLKQDVTAALDGVT